MSIRYGQKVSPSSTKKVTSSFVSYNRNDPVYTGAALPYRANVSADYARPDYYLTAVTPPAFNSQTDQKIVMLVAVSSDDSNFLAFSVTTSSGNFSVNWGDGTTETFASTAQAQRNYIFDSVSGAITDRFKQVLVTITPVVSGQTLTVFTLNTRHTAAATNNVYSQPVLEMYICCPNLVSLNIVSAAITSPVYTRKIRYINFVNTGSVTSFANILRNMVSLERVDIDRTAAITTMASMFSTCTALKKVTFSSNTVLSSLTTVASMFINCYSLVNAPLFDTRTVTNMNSMFAGCNNLLNIPMYDTRSVTDMGTMFQNCVSLETIPVLNTISVTTTASMFQNCYSLVSAPSLDTRNVTAMNSMFVNCYSLVNVPLYNTIKVTNMSFMFQSCYSLVNVPLFNTAAATLMTSMFNACQSLTTVPLFNTQVVTSMANMFLNCPSLITVPLFNTQAVTSMAGMFQGCFSLISVPPFNTASVTTMDSMFLTCYSLVTIPPFNTSNVTIMANMFNQCFTLTSIPSALNTAKVTAPNGMFSSCYNLITIPTLNLSAATTMDNLFNNCYSLASVPALNVGAALTFNTTFASCFSLASINIYNSRYTISFLNNKLSKAALETIFTNLSTSAPNAVRTITITDNWGALSAIGPYNGIPANGSRVISLSNTTNLSAGMQVAGNGSVLTSGRPVTLSATGNVVNLSAHGLSNGDEVAFTTLTTTTSILSNTIYCVLNAAADTFQLAISGSSVPLTINPSGTGIIKYNSTIESITANTGITVTRPMSGNGLAQQLTFRQLQTYRAVLKGYAIAG